MEKFYFSSNFDGDFCIWYLSMRAFSCMSTDFLHLLTVFKPKGVCPAKYCIHTYPNVHLFNFYMSKCCGHIMLHLQRTSIIYKRSQKRIKKAILQNIGNIYFIIFIWFWLLLKRFITMRDFCVCQQILFILNSFQDKCGQIMHNMEKICIFHLVLKVFYSKQFFIRSASRVSPRFEAFTNFYIKGVIGLKDYNFAENEKFLFFICFWLVLVHL